jgi:hypothetical protein
VADSERACGNGPKDDANRHERARRKANNASGRRNQHLCHGVTANVTVAVIVSKWIVSVGTKTTDTVCGPGHNKVPAAMLYLNVPGTFAVAFSCASPSRVPYEIAAGVGQVITGVDR